jgi:hypothetical protein
MAWGWLKKLGRGAKDLALPIALLFIPPEFTAIAKLVYGLIVKAEQNIKGEKRGAERLIQVMQDLEIAAPLIIDNIEKMIGKQIVDEDALAEAMKALVSFFVQIEKAVGGKPE